MTLNLVRRLIKGSPLTASEHDTNLDKLEGRILRPQSRGQASRTTTGSIVITDVNVYVSTGLTAVLDASTASGLGLGTTDQFGLINTSSETRLFLVYGSADIADGNNTILGLRLAVNGTSIATTECRASTSVAGQEAKLVTNALIQLAAGDEVSLFVANHTNTVDLDLRRGRIVATEIYPV
jgi:hypothetical protein